MEANEVEVAKQKVEAVHKNIVQEGCGDLYVRHAYNRNEFIGHGWIDAASHLPAANRREEEPAKPTEEIVLHPAVKMLADLMHLWVDGYLSKNPTSAAPESIVNEQFEAVEKLLRGFGISVDYCGWKLNGWPVDPPIPSAPTLEGPVKLNQYGLTREEWTSLVGFGGKLHDALMDEPEGEDWYDGQSLKIMESMVEVFKAGKSMVKHG